MLLGMARSATPPVNSFLQRLIGAMALDPAIYEEVEADRGAAVQAFIVVVLASLATGAGARGFDGTTTANAVFISIASLLAWASWALLTFEVGARLLPTSETRSNVGELLRTIGFAAAPGVLNAFALVPGITRQVFVVTSIWMLLTMVVGVRHALDYRSTTRAVLVCVFGWMLAIAIVILIGAVFGPRVA
jgi:hypothetical protein